MNAGAPQTGTRPHRFWRDNGLTLVLGTLFLLTLIGHVLAGHAAEVADAFDEGRSPPGLAAYFASSAFLSSLFENWESEFLQMWAYVMLTAYLFQRGSPESRDPDDGTARAGEGNGKPRSLLSWLHAHSLGLALLALFVLAFCLHWVTSARDAAAVAEEMNKPAPTLLEHLASPQLWFESFQNWQSEFLSTAILVVLGIFLRERLSPESKAVGDPNSKTGTE